MLGLSLREEFRGRRPKGTAIELQNANGTGATEIPASRLLEITYPSQDILSALEAVAPGQSRPLVLFGERGLGKSHVLAALHHALSDHEATRRWLESWSSRLGNPRIAEISLRTGALVISEGLQRQRYKFLWDLLLDRHPHGSFIRGKWSSMGERQTDVLPADLVIELLRNQPVALLLDEYQTWFDGLTNSKQAPFQARAFNFIQILSEIATSHPELLVLVVSVRNGTTNAYQQLQRVSPVLVNFKGPNAARDRRQLLSHRLFENRPQVTAADIDTLTSAYAAELLRLSGAAPAEHRRIRAELQETWPFAPQLIQLLEDQVLVATSAQETRDLIKILADLFRTRGDAAPVITAADFRVADDSSSIASLIDSFSGQHHAKLREKAQRNLESVSLAVPGAVPHLEEVLGALWIRSLAVGNLAGAEPNTLHVDITRSTVIDDNAFQVELTSIVENSFNIHEEGARLVFREEENPQAKLMATARNDRLFEDGSDRRYLAREIRYVLGGSEDVARIFRVVVLPEGWLSDPWSAPEEGDQPRNWTDERLPIVVLPEDVDRLNERLGRWSKDHLSSKRNTVRFLLPRNGSSNAYLDRDLLVLARATAKALEWKAQSPEYDKLHRKYQTELRSILKLRFDRFAVLDIWSFGDPSLCRFHVEQVTAQGDRIPEAIERRLLEDLFVPEDFERVVGAAASANDSLGKLLRALQEPRPNGEPCIPWLGEPLMKEKVLRLAARGLVALNVRGTEFLQRRPGEEEDAAWNRMKGRLPFGRQLDETGLLLPQAVSMASGPAPAEQVVGPLFTPPAVPTPVVPFNTAVAPSAIAMPGVFTPGTGTRVPLSASPTSPLNLLGTIERWGVGPGTTVHGVTLRVESASGAQVQKLLRSLPDGITYELKLEKEEG